MITELVLELKTKHLVSVSAWQHAKRERLINRVLTYLQMRSPSHIAPDSYRVNVNLIRIVAVSEAIYTY